MQAGSPGLRFARVIVALTVALVACVSWGYVFFELRFHRDDIEAQLREVYRLTTLPSQFAALEQSAPDRELLMPVADVRLRTVADTWGEARSEGRMHEGTDIFALEGTLVFSATDGFIVRTGVNNLGGNYVMVMGAGGRRYYYAHLYAFSPTLRYGDPVTTSTMLGWVGNTGNATGTPPHLHLGVYERSRQGPINPFPLLVDR